MKQSAFVTGLVVTALLLIVSSLGTGFYYLLRNGGQTTRVASSLRIRIILSLILFVTLFLAYRFQWIAPHSLIEGLYFF